MSNSVPGRRARSIKFRCPDVERRQSAIGGSGRRGRNGCVYLAVTREATGPEIAAGRAQRHLFVGKTKKESCDDLPPLNALAYQHRP